MGLHLWVVLDSNGLQVASAFSKKHLPVFPLKRGFSELCTWAIALLLESGVYRPSRKEVTKGGLQISQSLLQGDRANLIEKIQVVLFFPPRQHRRAFNVTDSFFPLREIYRINSLEIVCNFRHSLISNQEVDESSAWGSSNFIWGLCLPETILFLASCIFHFPKLTQITSAGASINSLISIGIWVRSNAFPLFSWV